MFDGRSTHFHNGAWFDGNKPLIAPLSNAIWMASSVFDGARAFDGVTPDLDQHCQRLVRSAESMGMVSAYKPDEIMDIVVEGLKRFAPKDAVYIRPMVWADTGFISPDPESSQFILSLMEAPIKKAERYSLTLSPFKRPSIEFGPTDAKASCLYPQGARALREAQARGFDNALMCDANGNVSELATANIWLVRDGVACTPVPNGTFLNGITRQRTIKLLREAGREVEECSLRYEDFLKADEIFLTGNATKVTSITQMDDRNLQPGPVAGQVREVYWDYALSGDKVYS